LPESPFITRKVGLEGSVRQQAGRVRITSQLITVRNQAHVWADSYERNSSDILVVQTEIARAVAHQIQLTLSPQVRQRLGGARRVNPEAYSDYLKGQAQAEKWSAEGMAKARAYFEQALQKDPDFASAYLGLGLCYLEYLITRRLPPEEAAIRAKGALGKALQLDENLGEAYTNLGFIDWQYDWNFAAAEEHLRRAIELSPNSVFAHAQLVVYLTWRGRPSEALAENAKAHELDPLAVPDENVAAVWTDYHGRDYRPMVQASQKYIAWNPAKWFGHYFLGVAYEGSGQPLQAIPEYQKAVELSGKDSDPTAALAYAYARTGKRAEAEKILLEFLQSSKTGYVSPYMIATVYAGLGDKDRAFEFVTKAYNERSTDLAYFLRVDLRMDTLRSDPRFQDLLRRMNFPP
jgi:tetratricopeptide (TPR) repeat protein